VNTNGMPVLCQGSSEAENPLGSLGEHSAEDRAVACSNPALGTPISATLDMSSGLVFFGGLLDKLHRRLKTETS